MPWTNYHSHSHYCDGAANPENFVQEAIRRNFSAWGLSSHAPLPFPCKWTMKAERLPSYLAEIDLLKAAYRDQIQIYGGLEVDYIPDLMGPQAARTMASSLDFIIGSVHFVDALPDGRPWEIDGRHEVFLEGLETIFHGNVQQAVEHYYGLIRQMVRNDAPDVVGHLDKIIIQNEKGHLFTGHEDWYQRAVIETLLAIQSRGLILEVNTRGIYKGLVKDPYPTRWILEKAAQMKIRLTLNSDAHHPREIDGAFPETAQVLREAGIRELSILWDGRWEAVSFDRWGLRIPGKNPVMKS